MRFWLDKDRRPWIWSYWSIDRIRCYKMVSCPRSNVKRKGKYLNINMFNIENCVNSLQFGIQDKIVINIKHCFCIMPKRFCMFILTTKCNPSLVLCNFFWKVKLVWGHKSIKRKSFASVSVISRRWRNISFCSFLHNTSTSKL